MIAALMNITRQKLKDPKLLSIIDAPDVKAILLAENFKKALEGGAITRMATGDNIKKFLATEFGKKLLEMQPVQAFLGSEQFHALAARMNEIIAQILILARQKVDAMLKAGQGQVSVLQSYMT